MRNLYTKLTGHETQIFSCHLYRTKLLKLDDSILMVESFGRTTFIPRRINWDVMWCLCTDPSVRCHVPAKGLLVSPPNQDQPPSRLPAANHWAMMSKPIACSLGTPVLPGIWICTFPNRFLNCKTAILKLFANYKVDNISLSSFRKILCNSNLYRINILMLFFLPSEPNLPNIKCGYGYCKVFFLNLEKMNLYPTLWFQGKTAKGWTAKFLQTVSTTMTATAWCPTVL